jgi:hypothetical protein
MIADNIRLIREQIQTLCQKNQITYPVHLMAVTKTFPVEDILEAHQSGQILFGENRIQEAVEKYSDPRLSNIQKDLHIIGHLQRNKAKEAVTIASTIQSIDKIETLIAIEKHASAIQKPVNFLIEVNTSGESQKHGVNPDQFRKLLDDIVKYEFKYCRMNGLMTVGPLTDQKAEIRKSFRLLKKLFDQTVKEPEFMNLKIISMGMSQDFQVAIEEGSNMIRIGTAIFGKR